MSCKECPSFHTELGCMDWYCGKTEEEMHKAVNETMTRAREVICSVYYPPVCDQLIDRGQKCYYGTHAGKECPPKGELACVCSGDHLEIENCRDCPKYDDCDLSFTIKREETS